MHTATHGTRWSDEDTAAEYNFWFTTICHELAHNAAKVCYLDATAISFTPSAGYCTRRLPLDGRLICQAQKSHVLPIYRAGSQQGA